MIEQLSSQYTIHELCEALDKSRSGYYQWSQRGYSAREQENHRLEG
jgi:hypothetical protein